MGYIFEKTASGRKALCCDFCGNSGDVRKRECPYYVLTDNARSQGRIRLRYCSPLAVCPACYLKRKSELHVHCKERAEESQREYDAVQARLDSGDKLRLAAWGSWYESVPDGYVGVVFAGPRHSGLEYRLITQSADDNRRKSLGAWLSDYPKSLPWNDHPGTTTKQVSGDVAKALIAELVQTAS